MDKEKIAHDLALAFACVEISGSNDLDLMPVDSLATEEFVYTYKKAYAQILEDL